VTHVLDTDHITILQRQNGREWPLIVERITRVGQRNVALSIVSFHEQFMGIHAQINRIRRPIELPKWYRRMSDMIDLYSKSNLVASDDEAAAEFETLRTVHKVRLDPLDLRIAAIALAGKMTLVSRNRADFEKVLGLALEDWTA